MALSGLSGFSLLKDSSAEAAARHPLWALLNSSRGSDTTLSTVQRDVPPLLPAGSKEKTSTSLRLLLCDTQRALEGFSSQVTTLTKDVGHAKLQVEEVGKIVEDGSNKITEDVKLLLSRMQINTSKAFEQTTLNLQAATAQMDKNHAASISKQENVQQQVLMLSQQVGLSIDQQKNVSIEYDRDQQENLSRIKALEDNVVAQNALLQSQVASITAIGQGIESLKIAIESLSRTVKQIECSAMGHNTSGPLSAASMVDRSSSSRRVPFTPRIAASDVGLSFKQGISTPLALSGPNGPSRMQSIKTPIRAHNNSYASVTHAGLKTPYKPPPASQMDVLRQRIVLDDSGNTGSSPIWLSSPAPQYTNLTSRASSTLNNSTSRPLKRPFTVPSSEYRSASAVPGTSHTASRTPSAAFLNRVASLITPTSHSRLESTRNTPLHGLPVQGPTEVRNAALAKSPSLQRFVYQKDGVPSGGPEARASKRFKASRRILQEETQHVNGGVEVGEVAKDLWAGLSSTG